MSQVSILAIDTHQNVDSIGNTNSKGTSEQSNSSNFSQVMNQQQQNKSGNNGDSHGKNSRLAEQQVRAADKSSAEQSRRKAGNADKAGNAEKGENVGQQVDEANKAAHTEKTASGDKTNSDGDHQQSSQQVNETASNEQATEDANVSTETLEQSVEKPVKDIAQQLLAFIQASDEVNTQHSDKIANNAEQSSQSAKIPPVIAQENIAKQQSKQQPTNDKVSVEGSEIVAEVESSKDTKNANNLEAKSVVDKEVVAKSSSEPLVKTGEQDDAVTKQAVITKEKSTSEIITLEAQKVQTKLDKLQTPPIIKEQSENTEQVVVTKESLLAGKVADAETFESGITVTDSDELNAKTAVGVSNTEVNIQGEKVVVARDESVAKTAAESLANQSVNDKNITQKVASESQPTERHETVVNSQRINYSSQGVADVTAAKYSQQQASSEQSQSQSEQTQQQFQQQAQTEYNELAEEQLVNSGKAVAHSEATDNVLARPTKTEAIPSQNGQQSTLLGEEHAFQHSLAKEHVDSMSVQSAKTVAQIHNETINIYRKDFSNAVKDKVMVMINQKIKQLDIRLDPPELGSMQVRLNLQNEQAAVNIVVQNQQAKEALEQNLHKLKDMLADSGVDVGDANIEQRQQQSEAQNGFTNQQGFSHHNDGESELIDDVMAGSQVNLYKASATGVDYYA